jgi:vesicle-associated membrane protein 4
MTSTDPKIAALQIKIDDSRKLMQSNLELTMDRGLKLHDVELKSNQLEEDAGKFRIGARRVHRLMCIKSWKWGCAIALAVVVLLVIIIVPTALAARK